jgi:hypothetical protein
MVVVVQVLLVALVAAGAGLPAFVAALHLHHRLVVSLFFEAIPAGSSHNIAYF